MEDDPIDGDQNCILCDSGTYASSTASTECLSCSAGKISVDENGNEYGPYADCMDCPTGKYAATTELSECSICEAGTYAPNVSSTGCSTTPAGFYTVAESANYHLTPCTAGYYGDDGATDSECSGVCSAGYYCPVYDSSGDCAYDTYTDEDEQMYETTSDNCNPIVDCGWADFVTKHADDGLVNYCTSTDDWLLDDTDDSATDIIYLYTPEFCKMGYELISYTATGTGCYPLNLGTPIFACSPCAKGTFKFPLTCF